MNSLNNVRTLGLIFQQYGKFLRLNGRRLRNLEIQKTWKLHVPDPMNSARYVAMAARKSRKRTAKRLGVPFRPVLGYVGSLSNR